MHLDPFIVASGRKYDLCDLPAPMKLITTTTNKQMATQAEFILVFLSQKSIKTAAALNSAGRVMVQTNQ